MSYGRIIKQASLDTQIEPKYIAAIIYEESKGNPWSFRYEPAFYKRYLEGKDLKKIAGYLPPEIPPTRVTEKEARACSWGLMQIMGQTAREHGFEGRYLTELLDPVVNICLGARIFAAKWKPGEPLETGLLRWNGGADKEYPERVKKWLKGGEYMFLLSPVPR